MLMTCPLKTQTLMPCCVTEYIVEPINRIFMSNETIKQDIKRKIDDLEGQLIEVKNKLEKEENPSDELKSLVNEMEDIQKDITSRYESEKNKADADWDEIDKNIYQDIQSFKKSMTKAGTLFSGK